MDSLRLFLQRQGRRKLIGASVILVLIVTIFAGVTYQTTKSNIQDELEDAVFAIDNFDILNATSESILIEFRLNVSNLEAREASIFIDSDFVDIVLFNGTEELAEISIPLGSTGFEDSKLIQAEIPYVQSDEEPVFLDFVNNLLSGTNFYLDFIGTAHFKVAKAFGDSLSFKNELFFIVNETALDLSIVEIELIELNSTITNLHLQIDNPFSTNFSVSGVVDTVIGNFYLGEIRLNDPITIVSGNTDYLVTWDLSISPVEAIAEILKRFNESIALTTDLNLKINELSIDVSPALQLSFGESLLDFNIVETTNFETDNAAQIFEAEFVIELTSNIPFQLNITSIEMDIATVSDELLGILNWSSSEIVSVEPYTTVQITNVTVILSDLSAPTLFEILLTQAVHIPQVLIKLQLFDEFIEVEFELGRVEL